MVRWMSAKDMEAMDGLDEARAGGRAGCVGVVEGFEVAGRGGESESRERPLIDCLSDSVKSTRRGRPLRVVPFRLRRADIAVSLSSYSQKPKPFARPVSWSYMRRKEMTLPTWENTSRSCSSVVSYDIFPTKTVVPGGRPIM